MSDEVPVNETPCRDNRPPPTIATIERRVAQLKIEVDKLDGTLPWWLRAGARLRPAALVTAPRSLPTRWRRYAQPGPLIIGMAGGWATWQFPGSIQSVLIIALLVAAVAIHRYVPDTLPTARLRR